MRQAAEKAVEQENLWPVSASGFRDTTRLAGTEPGMILDVLLTNRQAILAALEKYQVGMADLRVLLQMADESGLEEWLETTQSRYQAYRTQIRT
jgi:prephenate dehydrogenase